MKTRPIIFNSEMVRAILGGRKTQTRRVIKPQPPAEVSLMSRSCLPGWHGYSEIDQDEHQPTGYAVNCPYGDAGDELWLRETWRVYSWPEDPEYIQYRADNGIDQIDTGADGYYENGEQWSERMLRQSIEDCEKAGIKPDEDGWYTFPDEECPTRWRPSIHIPRWASRITLRVTGVRVERVQEITLRDVLAEGIEIRQIWLYGCDGDEADRVARLPFERLWNSINKKRGFGWDVNPWVFVVTFGVCNV
jgi:hypothetical protein